MKLVLQKSLCHTLDRNDWAAHADVCGTGMTDDWQDAVSKRYNITYWPYANADPDTATCL